MNREIENVITRYIEAVEPVIKGKGKVAYIPALKVTIELVSFCF